MKLGVFFLLALTACTFNPSKRACTKSFQCPNSQQCVWTPEDGCGGTGHCEENDNCTTATASTGSPMPIPQACGCDGSAFAATEDLTSGFPARVCGWDAPVTSNSPCK